MKAIEALGLIVPLYLLLFASTYFVMERAAAANFPQPLTRTDALYFAVTVFSTVGFGDIAAKSEAARVVVIFQMLGDLALLGAGVRVLLGAVRRGQQRRSDTGGDVGPGSRMTVGLGSCDSHPWWVSRAGTGPGRVVSSVGQRRDATRAGLPRCAGRR